MMKFSKTECQDPKFFILEKTVFPSASTSSSCLMFIRPCYNDPETYRRFLSNEDADTSEIVTFQGGVCFQKEDETEDEFLLRAACNGYVVSFVNNVVHSNSAGGFQYTISVIDEEKGNEYEFPLPKDVIENSKELQKWLRKWRKEHKKKKEK